ncbi:hypothetical protein P3X46_031531 [Hevea brasiliensis]|uniref:Protein kinase domain-containing protein n=2 Tax=Hevea brasiliensis TaxID=3981 RepID=A0ABQ9KML2_HEVBR|nr:hypothetical protein P3X46_031531 [Hevea brasiliensis]
MKEQPVSRIRRKSTTTTTASASSSRSIKLICSFNGAFHFRPPSNKLRYIGGETRIISVDRKIGFFKLLNKMSDLCPKLRSFSLKYQLPMYGSESGSRRARDPESDLETGVPLVSIASDEDVRCMIEEYDKLELCGKHARLWVFVCSSDGNECDSHDNDIGYENHNNSKNGFFKGNRDLWVNYIENDALRGGAKVCKAQFDDKVAKNPVKDVVRFRCGDDSLRKMVLRQQLLAKQSEGIHSLRGVNGGSEMEFVSSCEDTNHKYNQPLRDFAHETNASMPQGDLYQGNMLGYRIGNAYLHGSESWDRLVQCLGHRLHPLNPKDGNLHVETNSSTHCLSGQKFQVFGDGLGICAENSNHLHNSMVKNICDLHDAKRDSGIFGQGTLSHLNRENIMPWTTVCALRNNHWGGSTYPAKSPFSSGGYQNGIRNHRFIIANESGNQRFYPYQVKSHKNNRAEMGNHRNSRLDGRLSAVKCYPGLRPNSTISKQGPSARLYGSKQGGRTSMINSSFNKDNSSFSVPKEYSGSAVSLRGNSNSKDFHVAYHGEGASAGKQSLWSPKAVVGPSSCVDKTESQQDLLTGSLYETNEVPYHSMYENYNSVSLNNELFTVEQWKVVNISGLSKDRCSTNEAEVECNTNLINTGREINMFNNSKNGTSYLEREALSSVDLLYNLSLSSSEGVEPSASSPASSTVGDSSLKTESKPSDIMCGQLSTGPEGDKSNAVASNFSAPNAVSMEKNQEHEEEILNIEKKAETKESTKCSRVIGGIPSDLAAFYTHLANRELQTIKNSDLEYIEELGSGTYGTVYHGKWKGSSVAIKRIKPSCFIEGSLKEVQLVADFWKEAHMLGQLHHPNIVAFYGVVTDGPLNNLATVTEYMVNGSLKQVLRRKDRTIDRRKRIILAMDAVFGMEYLHEKNIVHFDLKSHNFLVNMKDPQRPVCKIGDLGLSKIKQRTLVSGGVRGTIPWMAPELLHSKNNMVTEKVDVYSFGIVMWELLTGEEPYANLNSEEIIAGKIKGALLPEIPSWCDPAWRSLMERCWSSDPESRPAFSEIAKELRTMSASMNIK